MTRTFDDLRKPEPVGASASTDCVQVPIVIGPITNLSAAPKVGLVMLAVDVPRCATCIAPLITTLRLENSFSDETTLSLIYPTERLDMIKP